MTPQDLKEEYIRREAYALGYKNGSADTITSLANLLQKETDSTNSVKPKEE